ncbi:MAG: FHA domain-containing protein [Deltaproteobacteria bacterium]|nr:MAG: FHA domain-containing protein [Deltaproteobacteria bacterium]
MALSRLVVIEGPDAGVEFPIPARGGGIGRGDDNAIQLSDLSVSRSHCTIELIDGRLALVDNKSTNRTLVNGKPITVHLLEQGDEIAIGKTRLAFIPGDGPKSKQRTIKPSRVTMEIGSGELLQVAREQVLGPDGRAQRHLAALARLGDALRAAGDRTSVAHAACDVAAEALAGDRAFVLVRDAAGRMMPIGSAVAARDPDGTSYDLAPDALDKVMSERKAIALEPRDDGGRRAVAAPLMSRNDEAPFGLLLVDRRPDSPLPAWDAIDLMACGCIAQLVSAAVAGVEARAALASENQRVVERFGGGWHFIGDSPPARQVLEFVGKVGPSDATVLLGGESGSGKEMVARAIHQASRRRDQAFIAVNCAALTETLLESELFGHEKGAFTGATDRKLGRFELADKGTLFLDEVGELNLNCQTKFLRVLEEQVFERVGGTRPIRVDVRVIAATNRDLTDMVRRGAFREDLFYRLSVIHTVVPPLRARRDDIPLLAEHFLQMLSAQVPRRIAGFTPAALAALQAHPWPGNVRELRNAVEYAIVLGTGEWIDASDLPPHIAAAAAGAPAPTPAVGVPPVSAAGVPPVPAMGVPPVPPAAGAPTAAAAPPVAPIAPAPPPVRPKSLRELEREGIIAALRSTGGNKAQAAQLLEIDRSTLYKKIKDYGIDV